MTTKHLDGAVRALAFVLGLCFVAIAYQALFEALALKIDNQMARIEAQLRDQDSIDPKGIIEARRLSKW